MTELLYLTDNYLKQCNARLLEITEKGVVLDQTTFYPGGGGQPADAGQITAADGATYTVSSAKRIDGNLVHLIDDIDRLSKGMEVTAEIDWDRRYKLMRTHTAMHILCSVVWRDYGAQVTGGNMEPCRGRMDFEFEKMEASLVKEIELKINAEIAAERPVRVDILAREQAFKIPDLIRTKINLLPPQIQEVRTIEIVGLDLQADGGTHVANTREVGKLRIADYKSKGRINKRLVVALEEDK